MSLQAELERAQILGKTVLPKQAARNAAQLFGKWIVAQPPRRSNELVIFSHRLGIMDCGMVTPVSARKFPSAKITCRTVRSTRFGERSTSTLFVMTAEPFSSVKCGA